MEEFKKYKVEAHLPSGMCCPYYGGNTDVLAKDEDDAIERAKKKIWEIHPGRKIVIDNVRRDYA